MRAIRSRLWAVPLVFCLIGLDARATSSSTDQSDLWYVQSESGWGMQLVQRGNTIFATLFVYGPNNQPTWYVATMQHASSTLTWTGPLYATTGPWFATIPFDAGSVGVTQVGTMTWNSQFVNQGTVTYSVNGTVVTKNVVRQTLVVDDFNGGFGGALHGTATNCFNPANNVTAEGFAAFAVSQTGSSITMAYVNDAGGNGCTFVGTLTQGGQFGTASGNYTCTVGEVGNFQIFEMNVGFNYLTARFSLNSTNNGCQTTGYLAGVRHR